MASSSWVKHSCRDRDIYHAQVRKTGPSPVRGLWVATNICIYCKSSLVYHLKLPAQFGRRRVTTSSIGHFSFRNIRVIGMAFQTLLRDEKGRNDKVICFLIIQLLIVPYVTLELFFHALFPATI